MVAEANSLLPPTFLSILYSIAAFVSKSISYLCFIALVLIYIFLFALALWLLVSLYCYLVEVIIWFLLERHTGSSPGRLIEIIIPDPNLRFTLKLAAVETRIWLSDLIDKFRGVSDERRGLSTQELPILLPEISYKTNEMQSSSIDCAICLDDFVDDELCRAVPVCNHIFHLHCIDKWLRHGLSCPTCRSPVAVAEV